MVDCQQRTERVRKYYPHYGLRPGGGQCTRKATYTDGTRFFCTQHAKVYATVMRKAENRIRPECRPIEPSTQGELTTMTDPHPPQAEDYDRPDSLENIFSEIEAERLHQDRRWGTTTDDTLNTPWMWSAYIGHYSTKWMAGTFPPLDRSVTENFRAAMVKVASIAVAAIQSIDRQRATGGKTFYEV